MRAVNQPHVSPARLQKELRGTKLLVSQEIFGLPSSRRRNAFVLGLRYGRHRTLSILGVMELLGTRVLCSRAYQLAIDTRGRELDHWSGPPFSSGRKAGDPTQAWP